MTVSVNGNDIAQIVQVAAIVGSIVATLVVGFIVYLMVRPSAPRARPRARRREADPAEAEELWRIVDLMERRLEVLERALADQLERPRAARTRAQDFCAGRGWPGFREEGMNMRGKRFEVDRENGKLAGVCAGIANRTGVDATIVRVGLVLVDDHGRVPVDADRLRRRRV